MTDAPPDFSFENAARADGAVCVVGVDEVGRGPLAGPVAAAAVRLDPEEYPSGLRDSKKLSPAKRLRLDREIREMAEVSIGHASVEEIDRLNILQASLLAMSRAVAGLDQPPDFALIDGKFVPRDLPCPAEAIVKGDGKSLSISAASIVAKVWRDCVMVDLAQQYPAYGWERNSGYPTPEHLGALQKHGATPHHRRSFAPVHKIWYQEKSVRR